MNNKHKRQIFVLESEFVPPYNGGMEIYMKIFAKSISLLLVVMLLSSVFSSCSINSAGDSSSGKKYTLTIWGAEEDQDMLRKMCEAYANANPQNTYEFLFGVQSESDSADKVLNDVQSGPDIYSFASDQINKLYAGGALARVGSDIEKTIKETNTPSSVDAASLEINGEEHLYAYPYSGDNCCFLYYDKRVFKDESKLASLDSILDTVEASKKTMHFKLNDDGWYLSSFFFSNPELKYNVTYNENMAEQAVEINYNSSAGLDVMKALRTYLNRNGLVAQTDDSKIIAAFTNGTAAAAVSGTWNAKAIEGILGENMGVCKLPTARIGEKQVQLSGYMGYKLIGVNGYSRNKGEAHKLALWLTNEQNQMKRFEARGFGPTNKNLVENEAILADPVMKAVMEQAKFNRAQKDVPGNYWTPMSALITPIITAKADGTKVTDSMLKEYLNNLCAQIAKRAG